MSSRCSISLSTLSILSLFYLAILGGVKLYCIMLTDVEHLIVCLLIFEYLLLGNVHSNVLIFNVDGHLIKLY